MGLPTLDGRECVPVRLLPFSTSWETLSPDVVAQLLGGQHPMRSWALVAYMLQPNGSYEPLPASWWTDFVNDLDALASSLQPTEHPKWRRESIGLLPRGVFVWRDDFVAEYTRLYQRPEQIRANRGLHSRELNFAPLLTSAEQEVVFEEFEFPLLSSQVPAPSVAGPDQSMPQDRRRQWTPELLLDLESYRASHGTKAAAEKFGISGSRVRQLLPREKPQPKGYSAFSGSRK